VFCCKSHQGEGSADSPYALSGITTVSESRRSNKSLMGLRFEDRFNEGNDKLLKTVALKCEYCHREHLSVEPGSSIVTPVNVYLGRKREAQLSSMFSPNPGTTCNSNAVMS